MTAPNGGNGGTGDGAAGGETPPANTFAPITSQDDLNRLIGERVERERAKFADYKDLKTKAAKFDEAEEASKSEVQKATDRATTAESERDAARAESLRLRVAVQHGISLEDADLFLTGTDEAALKAQAARLVERTGKKPPLGAPLQGRTPTGNGADPLASFTRGLFGRDS